MCGRYTISYSAEEIMERFKAVSECMELEPSFNVAPTQMVPVVVAETPFEDEPASRLLQMCRWGLIPFWVKDLKGAKPIVNARVETLTEKASFKRALTKQRCVLPADGFYEWKTNKTGKVPMRIRLTDKRMFGFAAIYQDHKAPDGTPVRTVAIVTVPANSMVSDIHDRMPAILTPEAEQVWLDPDVEDADALAWCLQPFPADELEAYPVSTLVNKPANNSPQLMEKVSEEQVLAEMEPPVAKRKSKKIIANAETQLSLFDLIPPS